MRTYIPAGLIGGLFLVACSGPDSMPAETDTSAGDIADTATMETGTDAPQDNAADGGKDETGGESAGNGFPATAPVGERVEYYVSRLRPQLPMPVNDSTIMDSVGRNGLEIELHYTVVDLSLNANAVERWVRDHAPANTCDNALTAQMVRDGASFRYSYSGGNLGRPVSVVIDRC